MKKNDNINIRIFCPRCLSSDVKIDPKTQMFNCNGCGYHATAERFTQEIVDLITTGKAPDSAFMDIKAFLESFDPEAPHDIKETVSYATTILLEPNCSKEDDKRALAILETAGYAGEYLACLSLSHIYLSGIGRVEKDPEKGILWLEKAAACGFYEAYDRLGSIYLQGEYVPADREKAFYYYKKGCDKGDPSCMDGYACMILGEDKPDLQLACKYLKMASEGGNVHAQGVYGWMVLADYFKGNKEEAKRLLVGAARRGESHANFTLGMAYAQGIASFGHNPRLAYSYIKKAADSGHGDAAYTLSMEYLTKEYLDLDYDPEKAANYLKIAMDVGNPDAIALYNKFNQKIEA